MKSRYNIDQLKKYRCVKKYANEYTYRCYIDVSPSSNKLNDCDLIAIIPKTIKTPLLPA